MIFSEEKTRVSNSISLKQADVLEEMAARLVHEISQPLTAIVNYTNGCIRRASLDETKASQLLPIMEQILLQAERAADSLASLRRRFSPQQPRCEHADLNMLIEHLLTDAIFRDFTIECDFAPNLPTAFIEPAQIEQVLFQLLQNSIEALGESPGINRKIKITTRLRTPNMVEVMVEDNGPGITAALANRLFEPFYTTKRDHIGLGLAISRRIVHAHDGELWIGHPAHGARLHFTLPTEARSHG